MKGRRYRVEHQTRYVHAGRTLTSQHVACLTPRTLPRQRLCSHELEIEPQPSYATERIDFFGNAVSEFTMLTRYAELEVMSRSVVEVFPAKSQVDPYSTPAWEDVRDELVYRRGARYDPAAQFSYPSPYVLLAPEVEIFMRDVFTPRMPILAGALALMHRIHHEFRFDPGATSITTPVTRVLAERRGVCQDFAHLQIACLRSLGLPARYVSGYLLTDPPPGQPRLVGADASHAWVSVRCARDVWVDLDPTNDVVPDARHITMAWGRDYGDVSPLRGVVLGGAEHVLHVGVSVMPLADEPGRSP
ncbi:MAG: transglutaminase family protein [Acidobacteriota bacterium]